ncbi:AfsR/SARP family transcriptional regulator [Streptomyces luteireticuli]|uniref:OmpR/PhoB-type domain-containing protein n=1 Tax=Streptomyces luteireticuli TaxID=173858 RepID=A0ABP3IDJ0_9ACTN
MEFQVLGPLAAIDHGVDYLPTAPKQRHLLALLLLNANLPVSTDTCMEELWEGDPPPSALPTLQTYILQIRRSLARSPSMGSLRAARQVLVTGSRSYRIVTPEVSLDLSHFTSLLHEGRVAQRDGDDRSVSSVFRRALALWRGEVLAGITPGPHLHERVDSLMETRLGMLEQCFEAELRLGLHHQLLSELGALSARHPLNENLTAQNMLALYRSGRQVEALDAFHRLRRTLGHELGIEPCLRVRQLHEAILVGDPRLDTELIGGLALLRERAG